jgi:hypothetical protein
MKKLINHHLADRFTSVFKENIWADNESISGPGSRKDSPAVLDSIEALSYVIENYNIESINDIPCGDFNWFEEVLIKYPDIKYCGFDIVLELIRINKVKFPRYDFFHFDITSNVPHAADLIFTKEVFIHLTNNDILLSLENMCNSGSKYMMSLNHFDCENIELSHDLGGYCRAVDLCQSPFNFPAPTWRVRNFGLWELTKI